uniref:Sister chromatid cohesion protein DCC1 n=2 Tax=Cacopsylla melanoneura TaxID=428564 RepID=A0A8D9AZH6_9HEMI
MSQEPLYQRTVEDSKVVIAHAKLDEDELCPVTQAIYLGDTMKSLRLMEIPQNILNEIKQGNRVLFRGTTDDTPVLCTQSQTFQVKEAETSNSLNLLPSLMFPDHPHIVNKTEEGIDRKLVRQNIQGIYYTYLELKPCKPRFTKLTSILQESTYVDHILENKLAKDTRKLYTMCELLNEIQSSETELEKELRTRNAGLIGGRIRTLEHDYNFRMISHILNLVDSNSWPLDQIDLSETKSTLEELVPSEIVEFLFKHYMLVTEGKTKENGEPYYCLIEDKICRLIGEALLRPTEKFILSEFLSVWQSSVPEGLTTSLKQLDGIAFVRHSSKPVVVQYFPEVNLSEDIKTRVDQLFQVQERWTLDDIRPYIECLATEKVNVNALLTKYARASNEGGTRYFSSRLGR